MLSVKWQVRSALLTELVCKPDAHLMDKDGIVYKPGGVTVSVQRHDSPVCHIKCAEYTCSRVETPVAGQQRSVAMRSMRVVAMRLVAMRCV